MTKLERIRKEIDFYCDHGCSFPASTILRIQRIVDEQEPNSPRVGETWRMKSSNVLVRIVSVDKYVSYEVGPETPEIDTDWIVHDTLEGFTKRYQKVQ